MEQQVAKGRVGVALRFEFKPAGDDGGGDSDTGESAQGLSLNGFQVQLSSESKYIGAHEDVNELGRTERAAMPFASPMLTVKNEMTMRQNAVPLF